MRMKTVRRIRDKTNAENEDSKGDKIQNNAENEDSKADKKHNL